jgi:hypothetical protein
MKFSLGLAISATLAVAVAYGGGEAVYDEKASRAKALATVPGTFVPRKVTCCESIGPN